MSIIAQEDVRAPALYHLYRAVAKEHWILDPAEIIVSEQALKAADINGNKLESRSLELKGIREPVHVRVMNGS